MMDNQVSDAETWNLGDIIKDNTNKEWKLVKVGSGETRSHKDSENQFTTILVASWWFYNFLNQRKRLRNEKMGAC